MVRFPRRLAANQSGGVDTHPESFRTSLAEVTSLAVVERSFSLVSQQQIKLLPITASSSCNLKGSSIINYSWFFAGLC
jgi:hypothetical protein